MKIILSLLTALVIGFCVGYFVHSQLDEESLVAQESEVQRPVLSDPSRDITDIKQLQTPTNKINPGDFSKYERAVLFAKEASRQQLKDRITVGSQNARGRPNNIDFDVLYIYLGQLLDEHPSDTVRFLLADETIAYLFFTRAFCSWVDKNLEAAVDNFITMQDSNRKRQAASCILRAPGIENIAKIDEVIEAAGPHARQTLEAAKFQDLPAALAFEQAQSLSGMPRFSALGNIVQKWIKQDINAALTAISSLKNRQELNNLAQIALSETLRSDPERALLLARTYFPDSPKIFTHIIINMPNNNVTFERSRDIAESYALETGNYRPLESIVSRFAASDMQQALAYIESLPQDKQRSFQYSITGRLSRESPHEALTYAIQLEDSFANVKNSVFRRYAKQFPDQLEARLQTEVNKTNREQIIQAIAEYKLEQNPEEAMTWLENFAGETGYEKNRQMVVAKWARVDPAAAGTFIKDNYDHNEPSREISSLVKRWMHVDAEAAIWWVSELPEGSISQQQGIVDIATVTAYQNPEAAFNMIKDVTNVGLRNNAILLIARTWAAREPDRIDTIAEVLGLDPKTTSNLKSYYRGQR